MKQTAIDFLIEKLQLIEWIEDDGQPHEQFKIIVQAKEMEKQQIIDAYYKIGKDNTDMVFPIEKDAEQYYNDTYGSSVLTEGSGAVGDKGGAVSKGSDAKDGLYEIDNYLTPVDWLMDRIKWIHEETYNYLIKEGQYDRAKRMESSTSSQTEISDEKPMRFHCVPKEISDEEIEDRAAEWMEEDWDVKTYYEAFIDGASWYREQLKISNQLK
jgi:hypothetical protein